MVNQVQILVILFIGFSFLPFSIRAANPLDVVINEIAWMGTEVEGIEPKNWWRYEWFELYNNTDQTISLEGWKIELYRTELDWTLQLRGVILPRDYFLIVASDQIFPNYDLNYSNLGGKFINSGQKVLLKDNSGNIIDSLDCFSYGKWFAGNNKTKHTMERKNPQLDGSNPDNWQTSQNPGGTPKAKNNIFLKTEPEAKEIEETVDVKHQQTNYPSGIVINEILPSPIGPDEEKEWIEIFNQNGFEVDLSGWQIADTKGTSKTYIFPKGTIIGAKRFLVLSRPTSQIILNNEGDTLNLIQPDGKIIDSVSYQKAPRGQSYNRTKSDWLWSPILTPGAENVIKEQETEENMPANMPADVKHRQLIDINTASLEELMKIIHIGKTRAEELISLRPFYSLDDLTKIKGINPERLEDIKKQSLAWVDPNLKPPKTKQKIKPEKGLASVAEPIKQGYLIEKIPESFSLFLVAFSLAIFSGTIILILKQKLKNSRKTMN